MSEIKIIKPSMFFLESTYRFEFPYNDNGLNYPNMGSQCKEITVQNYAGMSKEARDQSDFIILCRLAGNYDTKQVAVKISNFLKLFESVIKEKEITTIIIKKDHLEIHVPKMWRINSVIFSFFLSIVKWGILFDEEKHKVNGLNKISTTFIQEIEYLRNKHNEYIVLPNTTGQITSFKKIAFLLKKNKSIYKIFNEFNDKQWEMIHLTHYSKNGMNEFHSTNINSTLRQMCLKEVKK